MTAPMPALTGYAELQDRLGYVFRDPALLRLALTHPSVAHEQGAPLATNQRLEFLGDAVLQLVLTRELYEKFPAVGEGPLTKARAKLVNRRTLAERARHLGVGQYLILSRGEEMHGGRERPSALADTYEALLGAVFLDAGFEAARDFILRQFQAAFGGLEVIPILENPKGELQELLQAVSTATQATPQQLREAADIQERIQSLQKELDHLRKERDQLLGGLGETPNAPHYRVVSAFGPDHDRMFECSVHHGGVELARGQGKSKKEAETEAAFAALATLRQKKEGGTSTPL